MSLTPEDVKALDLNAEVLGVPTSELMEHAGRAVAETVEERWPEGTVVVFCGKGNNGGDGAVAARHLKEAGRRVSILLAARPDDIDSDLAREALSEAEDAGVPIVVFSDPNLEDVVEDMDLVVDAMLGVGISGSLRPPTDRIVETLSGQEVPIVAVDLPTGHDTDTPLVATVTVTMHDVKAGMDPGLCGEILVADIGIPEDAQQYVGPGDLVARYPMSGDADHKGDHGRVLAVLGGPYTGAPVLCALGAFGTGVDLMHMMLPGRAAEAVMFQVPEAIVHPLEGPALQPDHVEPCIGRLDETDVLLMGPGLGRDDEGTKKAVLALLEAARDADVPVVADADALLADHAGLYRDLPGVLTPHAAELLRISDVDVRDAGPEGRIEGVQDWLDDGATTILLKGPEDIIVDAEGAVRNRMHHPVMTTGGTGDVLAGCVAALLARGCDPFDAARVGAWLNGAAGQLAFAQLGYGVRASDVAARIPLVLGHWFGYGFD